MRPTDDDALLDELIEVARTIAVESGALIRAGRPAEVEVAGTKSTAQDIVTAMDLAVEAHLRARLGELRPDDAVLGEEGGSTGGTSGVTWVVDPIDGTVNYLYGLPSYSVSVAAVVGPPDPSTWTVLAGCVHAPVDGRTFVAGRGRGATLDGEPIRVREAPSLLDSLVGTGFGYREERRRSQGRVVAAVLPRVRDIRRIGSAALDLCAVASGSLDLYYERGLSPWDLAAGELIAREAGAQVSGLRGLRPGTEMTVAGHPVLQAELAALLAANDADTDF
ncbi:inositol monophosphatase family protein [Cellulomonas sp. PhB150]|uniref:inositol monophosphatase family protein n=1 Tax=Cellulomonas sp. PhB150 TaxID=2485188 RepID=UPI000F4910CB|nr:inositol monophosphatase family protein [Cellulomonas sp. PhB150]ROS30870.1 myo-inositol-1(or 4)-monophosphatase [Cellulomonas sp. PhB150]